MVNLVPDPYSAIGAEQGGTRPARVISSAHLNQIQKYLSFVVPITGTDRGLEYQIRTRGRAGGLGNQSVLMYDQARSISVQRFRLRRGAVSDTVLRSTQLMVGRLIDAADDY